MSFRDGQKVTHRRWTDDDGKPLRGTVRLFPDALADEASGEVQWHGIFAADELDLVAGDID